MDPDTDLGRRNQSGSMRDCGPVSGFTKLVFLAKSRIWTWIWTRLGISQKQKIEFWERREQFSKLNFFTLRLIFVPLFSQLCGSGSDFNRVSGFQCCGSGMFIPDPGYQIWFFPPGSRVDKIPDPGSGSRIQGFKKAPDPGSETLADSVRYRTKI